MSSQQDYEQIIQNVHDVADSALRVNVVAGGTSSTTTAINDGVTTSTKATVKAGSTAPVAGDTSLVVTLSPNSPRTPPAKTITQSAITVGTSAVRATVSGSSPTVGRAELVITPDSSSSATFYIGSSSVTTTGATRGIPIIAGQSFIADNDAGDYYIISSTASQTVFIMEQS